MFKEQQRSQLVLLVRVNEENMIKGLGVWLGGGSTGQEQNLDCVALWRPSGESASRRD